MKKIARILAFHMDQEMGRRSNTRHRNTNANSRTRLNHIIAKAGLEPWPKLFANLRASRATKLAGEHPAHVAAAWLGHSTLVANKYYWQVTEADFTKATTNAAQNAAQSTHASHRNESQDQSALTEKPLEMQGDAKECETVQECLVGDTGFEPVTSAV